MAQSIITLSNEELTHLCETSIDQKKGLLFYKIIRLLGLNVKAVPLSVNGKEKPLLYIPGFTWLIDLNHNAAHEFIEDPSLATQSFAFDPTTTAISELLKPYGEEFDKCIYCPLCNIIQGDDDNFIVCRSYFDGLLDKEVHRHIGSIDTTLNNKFSSRIEVESLLGYPQDCDSFEYEVTGHLGRKGVQSEDHNNPELYIYSLHQYGYSLGFAKDGTIREITTNTNFSDMTDGQKRLIFVPFNFEQYLDFDHPFEFNENPAVDDWFEKERNVPLEFVGEYALDLAESNQEGCFVWKRVNTKIHIL